jgi:hypothetical protein
VKSDCWKTVYFVGVERFTRSEVVICILSNMVN